MFKQVLPAAMAALMLTAAGLAQGPATAPTAVPATVPATTATAPDPAAEVVSEMTRTLAEAPEAATPQEFQQAMQAKFKRVMALLGELEGKHPQSRSLHEGRMIALVGGSELAWQTHDAAIAAEARAVGEKVLASQAPADLKLHADAYLTAQKIMPIQAAPAGATEPQRPQPAADAADQIRQFIQRHAAMKPEALGAAAALARLVGDAALAKEFQETLVKDFPDSDLGRQIRRARGEEVDVGQPFEAALTTLDGAALKLPADRAGKALVVEFWSTTCVPCIIKLPALKDLYEKYQDKGVAFIGVPLDNNKEAVSRFVAEYKVPWTETFSAPEAVMKLTRRYGVRATPTVIVVDPKGKIVAVKVGAENLEELIEEALGHKAPSTATAPAAAPGDETPAAR